MSDHTFDWSLVDKAVNKKRTAYEYEENKHLFKKVAFDRFKSIDGTNQLWELRASDDGKQYLFALYGEAEDLISESSKENNWKAVVDSDAENITLSFKKVPVHKISLASYGYDANGAADFASFISKKANKDEQGFVNKLLSSMSEKRREAVSKLIKGE